MYAKWAFEKFGKKVLSKWNKKKEAKNEESEENHSYVEAIPRRSIKSSDILPRQEVHYCETVHEKNRQSNGESCFVSGRLKTIRSAKMSERKVIYFIKVGNGVIGFAIQNGVGLLSSMIDATGMKKRDIETNFVARFAAQRLYAVGKGKSDGGVHWEFEWLDYDKVINCGNQQEFFIEKPAVKSGKPKIYEIKQNGKDYLVITHDKELLTSDEVTAFFDNHANKRG